jgi:hypothetical protein
MDKVLFITTIIPAESPVLLAISKIQGMYVQLVLVLVQVVREAMCFVLHARLANIIRAGLRHVAILPYVVPLMSSQTVRLQL